MPPQRLMLLGVLAVALIFKFWLIAALPITDDTDDPPNYVAQMLHDGPNFFGPGTGLAGRAFACIGLPYRVGLELAYLLACLLAVRALLAWPFDSPLALGLFLFTSFNPTAEELFSHVLSDPVWMVEIVLGLALLILFAMGRGPWRWLWLAPAVPLLALSTITRTTLQPLTAVLVFWGALVLFSQWRRRAAKRFLLEFSAGLLLVLAGIGIVYQATCWHNAATFGYEGLSLPDSREYRDFYMTLQSVGEPAGDRYYPVDTARLDLIAQAGPASRGFVEAMKTDANFRRVSQRTFGKYDFALGWFHFVVFFNTVPGGDLTQGFRMFRTIEDEIATAGREGQIKTRTILPLPDCRLGVVASALPAAVCDLGAFIPFVPAKYAWAQEGEPKFDNSDFTQALHRGTVERSSLGENAGAWLCRVYAPVYRLLLPALGLAWGAYLAGALLRRKTWPGERGDAFAARQLFLLAAIAFFAWNALFSASGVPVFARYVILQNVLLPLLVVYYARLAWGLLLRGPRAANLTQD